MHLDKRGSRLKVELHRGPYDPSNPHGNPEYSEHGSIGVYKTWQGRHMSCYVLVDPGDDFYILIKWIGRTVDRETFDTYGADALAISLDIDDGQLVKNHTIYIPLKKLKENVSTLGGLIHNFRKEQLEEDSNGALVNAQDYVEGLEATESDKLYSRTFAVDGIHMANYTDVLSIAKFRAAIRDGHQDMNIGEEDLDSLAPRSGSVTVTVERVNLVSSTRDGAFLARADEEAPQPQPALPDQGLIAAGIPLRVALQQVPCPIELRLPVRATSVENGLVGIYKFLIRPREQFDRIKAEQPTKARVDNGPAPGIVFSDLDEEATNNDNQPSNLCNGTGFDAPVIPGTASGIGSYLNSFPALAIAETKANAKHAADQAAREYAKNKKSEAAKQKKQAQSTDDTDACAQDGPSNESIVEQAVSPADPGPTEEYSAQDVVSFHEDDANMLHDIPHLRSTGYYPRARYQVDQTRASTVFIEMFPKGYETLQTSSTGLLCGLNAAILSLCALNQVNDKIPVPTIAELQKWQDSDEYRARIIQFELGRNDNHLFVDQVALIIQLLAEREHKCPLQLGYLLRGHPPQLLPYAQLYEYPKMAKPEVFFIYNDNAAAEDAELVNHFQGMRATAASLNKGDATNSTEDKQNAQDMVGNEADIEMGGADNPEGDCEMPDADNEPQTAHHLPTGATNLLSSSNSLQGVQGIQSNAMPPPSSPKNHKSNMPLANQAHGKAERKKHNDQDAYRHLHRIHDPAHRIAKKQKQRPPHGAPRGPRADFWPPNPSQHRQLADLYRPDYNESRPASPEF